MITEESVYRALETVIDPEIGIDIVNLGFIYNVAIEGDKVGVTMTLTAQGCPLHGTLKQQAENAVLKHVGAAQAEVKIVFEPPWNPRMMSTAAKEKLGFDDSMIA